MNQFSGFESAANAHPLFVHFPIALILTILLFETLWWITKKEMFRSTSTHLFYISALAVVVTVISGYIASEGLGHDSPQHDLVHKHRDIMLWMSGLFVMTTLFLVFVKQVRDGKWRRLLILPLLLISGLLVYGSDKGASLVFEHGMGVKKISTQHESAPLKMPDVESGHSHDSESHQHSNEQEHKH